MKSNKRMILSIFWILIGTVLLGCSFAGLTDAYWSGMGGGLFAAGILQLARHIRYRTDREYRESVDVEANDERNRYISNKAWAWAGYCYVLIAAVSVIVLKISGYEELVPIASGSVCLIVVLYWISFLCLRRKY